MSGAKIQKGHAMAALVVGVLEIVLALIVIICSFVLSSKASLSGALTPYWAGIPYLIPGILGVATGITKNKCAMIANMILNIICFVLQGVGTILVAIVMAFWAAFASAVQKHLDQNCTDTGNVCRCKVNGRWETISGIKECGIVESIISLMYALVAMLIIAAIVALAGSIIGCVAVCCTNTTQPATVIVQQQPVAYVNQQPGGQVQYANQPGAVNEAPPGYGEKQ